jgi:small neutral amino acid transporter SnatA (MarC family)
MRLRRVADVLLPDLWHFVVEIFEVPLSMVRIVSGIILMRTGFSLFMPSATCMSLSRG